MTAKRTLYTITINKEYGSKEITFYSKPSEEARDFLKSNRFRWHKAKCCWYGFFCMEDLKTGLLEYGYNYTEVLPKKPERAKSVKRLQREKNEEENKRYLEELEYNDRKEKELLTEEEKAEEERRKEVSEETLNWIEEVYDENAEYAVPCKNGYFYENGLLRHYTNGELDLIEI